MSPLTGCLQLNKQNLKFIHPNLKKGEFHLIVSVFLPAKDSGDADRSIDFLHNTLGMTDVVGILNTER